MDLPRGQSERTSGAGGGVRLAPGELSALICEWPEAAREEYEERAAILEADARMVRDRAERAAEHIVRDRWKRGLL